MDDNNPNVLKHTLITEFNDNWGYEKKIIEHLDGNSYLSLEWWHGVNGREKIISYKGAEEGYLNSEVDTIYYYNEENQIEERRTWEGHDYSEDEKLIVQKYFYEYNDEGRLLEKHVERYDYFTEEHDKIESSYWSYKGNNVFIVQYGKKKWIRTIHRKYKDGLLIRSKTNDLRGKVKRRFTYNEYGWILTLKSKYIYDETNFEEITYEYEFY